MSKKINFANVNTESQKALSSFFYAVFTAADLAGEKASRAKSLDAKIKETKDALNASPNTDTLSAYNKALADKVAMENDFAFRVKALKPFKDAGLALIPDGAYENYKALMASETERTRSAFNANCKNVLETMGVKVTTQTQLNNTVGWLRSHTSGVVKSGNKAILSSGKLTAVKSKSQFNELFVRVLVDLLIDKKVCEFSMVDGKSALKFFEYDENGEIVK